MKTKDFDGGLFKSPPQEVVLGIDQSYSGFAITALAATGDPAFYTWVYKAEGTGVTRLKNIQEFLYRVVLEELSEFTIADAAMEGYAYSATMGHMAGELGAVVKIVLVECIKTDAQYPLIIAPSQLKKYVTGKGTGVAKNQMLLQTFKVYGVEFSDDNACDSFGLAMIASGRSLFAHQSEILAKLQAKKYRERP